MTRFNKYSGLCRIAARSRSNMETSSPPDAGIWFGIQFSWYSIISRVSSMDTIFAAGGINCASAFKVVVFPLAVSPMIKTECPVSTAYQRYAISSMENVLKFISWTGVKGYFLNLLREKVEPLAEVDIKGTKVKVAVAHGLGNARKIMEEIKEKKLSELLLQIKWTKQLL